MKQAVFPSNSMEDLSGRQLGPYRVVAALGEGGMAAVYKAYQPSVDRYVALKILSTYFTSDPQFRERFRHEANLVAQFQHPSILPVFDFGEIDGYAYLAMPFVGGGTLASLLRSRPPSLESIVRIVHQLGDALDYAHSKGVVHRDIKPSNVLIDEHGNCLLADFGIARAVEHMTRLTLTGAVLGTPAYMSPEQAAGEEVGPRSDIYSLGIVLYELLTGRVPFKAETPLAVAIKHLTAPLPPPHTLNPMVTAELEAVVLKALARSPADRFASASLLAAALAEAARSARPFVSPTQATIERSDDAARGAAVGSGTVRRRLRVSPWVMGLAALLPVALMVLYLRWPRRFNDASSNRIVPTAAATQPGAQASSAATPASSRLTAVPESAPMATAIQGRQAGRASAVGQAPPTRTTVAGGRGRPEGSNALMTDDAGRGRQTDARASSSGSTGSSDHGLYDQGTRYLRGDGVQVDYGTAASLFQRSCDGGDPLGCSALAVMYWDGNTALSNDDARAVGLFEKACGGGVAVACEYLGNAYVAGRGGAKDVIRATERFGRAADLYAADCKPGTASNSCSSAARLEQFLRGPTAPLAKGVAFTAAHVGGRTGGILIISPERGLSFYHPPDEQAFGGEFQSPCAAITDSRLDLSDQTVVRITLGSRIERFASTTPNTPWAEHVLSALASICGTRGSVAGPGTTSGPVVPALRDASAPRNRFDDVDISRLANAPLDWLSRPPVGTVSLGGIEFKMLSGGRAVIHTANPDQPSLPKSLSIPLAQATGIGKIHLLIEANWTTRAASRLIGSIRLHYSDGAATNIPLVTNQTVTETWGYNDQLAAVRFDMPPAGVTWQKVYEERQARCPRADAGPCDATAFLHRLSIIADPGKALDGIDITGNNSATGVIVAAITLEHVN